ASWSGLTPSGKLRARPASMPQTCDNPSMHCTAALPARQLHLLVMPMPKENASRADDAYSGDERNLPRSYCRRPPRSPQHPPTNATARATKPDAIQGARPREATKPTTTCTTNWNCRERAREASPNLERHDQIERHPGRKHRRAPDYHICSVGRSTGASLLLTVPNTA